MAGFVSVASAVNDVLVTRVASEFWVFADTAAGYMTDQAVAAFCEQVGADEETAFMLGIGAGLLTGMAMDQLRPGLEDRKENRNYIISMQEKGLRVLI